MIYLTDKMPDYVEVEGKRFDLRTDYRVWIKYGNIRSVEHRPLDLAFVFESGAFPRGINAEDWIAKTDEFYACPSATPNATGGGSERVLFDFNLDGDYIYGSFMRVFNIDLIDIPHLHWHKFKALFTELGAGCKMGDIMGFRAGTKLDKNRTPDQAIAESERAWRLPISKSITEQTKRIIEDEFYNT